MHYDIWIEGIEFRGHHINLRCNASRILSLNLANAMIEFEVLCELLAFDVAQIILQAIRLLTKLSSEFVVCLLSWMRKKNNIYTYCQIFTYHYYRNGKEGHFKNIFEKHLLYDGIYSEFGISSMPPYTPGNILRANLSRNNWTNACIQLYSGSHPMPQYKLFYSLNCHLTSRCHTKNPHHKSWLKVIVLTKVWDFCCYHSTFQVMKDSNTTDLNWYTFISMYKHQLSCYVDSIK